MANESKFVQSLTRKLKLEGCVTQRLESHSTGVGLPDLLVFLPNGNDIFVECKAVDKETADYFSLKVEWRPGQLAWAHDYAQQHKDLFDNGFIRSRCTFTLIKTLDELICVRMDDKFSNNTIRFDSDSVTLFELCLLREVTLKDFFLCEWWHMQPTIRKLESSNQSMLVRDWIDAYRHLFCNSAFVGDLSDKVIWEYEDLVSQTVEYNSNSPATEWNLQALKAIDNAVRRQVFDKIMR